MTDWLAIARAHRDSPAFRDAVPYHQNSAINALLSALANEDALATAAAIKVQALRDAAWSAERMCAGHRSAAADIAVALESLAPR